MGNVDRSRSVFPRRRQREHALEQRCLRLWIQTRRGLAVVSCAKARSSLKDDQQDPRVQLGETLSPWQRVATDRHPGVLSNPVTVQG
jgi:hypothetical protein